MSSKLEEDLSKCEFVTSSLLKGQKVPTCTNSFLISNFLSPEECKTIIELSEEIGFNELPSGRYDPRVRNNTKISISNSTFADKLFQHIQSKLISASSTEADSFESKLKSTSENHDIRVIPSTIYLQNGKNLEKWNLSKIHESIRICRYEPSQLFGPHYDEPLILEDGHMSFYSMTIYLNTLEDGQGGHTRFYKTKNEIDYSYKPQAGDCLFLDSEKMHDGEILNSGRKYILRTEVLYLQDCNSQFQLLK